MREMKIDRLFEDSVIQIFGNEFTRKRPGIRVQREETIECKMCENTQINYYESQFGGTENTNKEIVKLLDRVYKNNMPEQPKVNINHVKNLRTKLLKFKVNLTAGLLGKMK